MLARGTSRLGALISAFALVGVVSGCTSVRETTQTDPSRCVQYIADPGDHHSFQGAGDTRVWLTDGDTLAVWALDVGWLSEDSLTFFLGEDFGSGGREDVRVVAPTEIAGSYRPWKPLRERDMLVASGLLIGVMGAAYLSVGEEFDGWESGLTLGLAATGFLGGFFVAPELYRREDTCRVVP